MTCDTLLQNWHRCAKPVTWNIAAKDCDGQYSRAQSTCDEHLALRLREFYDACIVDDETAAQVRPYDPGLRELID